VLVKQASVFFSNQILIRLTEDANLLIQDCTYFNDEKLKEYKHASVTDVIKMLKKVNIKQIILIHISRRYKNLDDLKKRIKDYPTLKIAEDFMKVTI
jgi:ribonuclease Z